MSRVHAARVTRSVDTGGALPTASDGVATRVARVRDRRRAGARVRAMTPVDRCTAARPLPVGDLRPAQLLLVTTGLAATGAFLRDRAEHATVGGAFLTAGVEAAAVVACLLARAGARPVAPPARGSAGDLSRTGQRRGQPRIRVGPDVVDTADPAPHVAVAIAQRDLPGRHGEVVVEHETELEACPSGACRR